MNPSTRTWRNSQTPQIMRFFLIKFIKKFIVHNLTGWMMKMCNLVRFIESTKNVFNLNPRRTVINYEKSSTMTIIWWQRCISLLSWRISVLDLSQFVWKSNKQILPSFFMTHRSSEFYFSANKQHKTVENEK